MQQAVGVTAAVASVSADSSAAYGLARAARAMGGPSRLRSVGLCCLYTWDFQRQPAELAHRAGDWRASIRRRPFHAHRCRLLNSASRWWDGARSSSSGSGSSIVFAMTTVVRSRFSTQDHRTRASRSVAPGLQSRAFDPERHSSLVDGARAGAARAHRAAGHRGRAITVTVLAVEGHRSRSRSRTIVRFARARSE